MAALSELLRAQLERDSHEDLEPAWREFFEEIQPDLGNLPDWEIPEIFPGRLAPGPRQEREVGIPPRHMLRAFDGVLPDAVKVVVLGQDPYPRRGSATGRAFEDGQWNPERPATVAPSLRKLLQSAGSTVRPALGIPGDRDDWPTVRDAIKRGRIAPPNVRFFDSLAEKGVLLINAAWTFTSKDNKHKAVHLRVWKPLLDHLIRSLAQRDQGVVFLLLGKEARETFCAADPILNRSAIVDNPHPSTPRYFDRTNPLVRVNEALANLGTAPVQWWNVHPDLPQ